MLKDIQCCESYVLWDVAGCWENFVLRLKIDVGRHPVLCDYRVVRCWMLRKLVLKSWNEILSLCRSLCCASEYSVVRKYVCWVHHWAIVRYRRILEMLRIAKVADLHFCETYLSIVKNLSKVTPRFFALSTLWITQSPICREFLIGDFERFDDINKNSSYRHSA